MPAWSDDDRPARRHVLAAALEFLVLARSAGYEDGARQRPDGRVIHPAGVTVIGCPGADDVVQQVIGIG